MNAQTTKAIRLFFLIILLPSAYLAFLEATVPHRELRLVPIWEDVIFQTSYQHSAFSVENFTERWNIAWTFGQTNESAGFKVDRGTGILFARFSGFNYANERGVSGIMVQREVSGIDTVTNPYLVIRYKASSSDFPLMFSYGITDDKGIWHDGGWHHTQTSWSTIEADLRKIHNGAIKWISIRLTNDFDTNYAGGTQSVHIESIVIYRDPEKWTLICNRPLNANIQGGNGTLKIHVSGDLPSGTIVSAQRYNISLKYAAEYLRVRVRSTRMDIAPRIVIWLSPEQPVIVLLKTYNDRAWHSEIIHLPSFRITNKTLFLMELGWIKISDSETSEATVYFKDLSLNVVGGK